MISNTENLKTTKELFKLINEFSKNAEYKINTHKFTEFLPKNKEVRKRERKQSHFIRTQKPPNTKKGRNVTKKGKERYSENHKTQMKEIEHSTNQQRDNTHGGRINSVKMSAPPKAINRLNVIPIKKAIIFFTELLILK